jgi:hypothetical protein
MQVGFLLTLLGLDTAVGCASRVNVSEFKLTNVDVRVARGNLSGEMLGQMLFWLCFDRVYGSE